MILFMYEFSTPVVINMREMNKKTCYVLDVELVISISTNAAEYPIQGDTHRSRSSSTKRNVQQEGKYGEVSAGRVVQVGREVGQARRLPGFMLVANKCIPFLQTRIAVVVWSRSGRSVADCYESVM